MVVLAIAAHPDDIELGCAGTLAKFARRGDKVFMGSLTNGNVGRPDTDLPEMARIRKAELEASADLIGAEVIWMDIDDELSDVSVEARLKMVDVFRYCKPDLVITHTSTDYHPDHRNCGQLVLDASPLACVPKIERELPFLEKQFLIYFMDNLGGVNFLPTEYVDITDVVELKKQMFECHESQISYMKDVNGFDPTDIIEISGRFRGFAAGCCYAEGFTKFDAWYRGLTNRVLP